MRTKVTDSFERDEIVALVSVASLGCFMLTGDADDPAQHEEGRLGFYAARSVLERLGTQRWNVMLDRLNAKVLRAWPDTQTVHEILDDKRRLT